MSSDDENGFDSGRRAERLPVDAETRLRPNSWSSLQIRMLDLSASGFRAQCEARVRPGGSVSLDVPGIGSVDAQVEWQRGDQFGARFFAPIEIKSCQWTFPERHHALARLLVERAGAKRAGRRAAESQIRREILSTLPMRKGVASA
ncbi:MAG TPA: PilZ domain-containing protein [Allosphingosinicella sp.]|nr:PilZ domain-containing protein [Allosphingosinicella sp.]